MLGSCLHCKTSDLEVTEIMNMIRCVCVCVMYVDVMRDCDIAIGFFKSQLGTRINLQ